MVNFVMCMPHQPLLGFSAISFDIGGTLFEPLPLPFFDIHKKFILQVSGDDIFSDEEISKSLDVAYTEFWKGVQDQDMHYFFSNDDWIERNRILFRTLGVTDSVERRSREMQVLWNEIFAENPARLKVDTINTLEELRARGYQLAISTNWDNPITTLKSLGIYDLFQSIQHSIVPGYAKPSPYMLIQNAIEMGVNPNKCAFIGDHVDLDMAAAERAGMHQIFIVNKGREVPPHDGHLTIIHELSELLELFQ